MCVGFLNGEMPEFIRQCVYLFDPAIPFLGTYVGDVLACVAEMWAERDPGSVWKSRILETTWCPAVGLMESVRIQPQWSQYSVQRTRRPYMYVVVTGQLRGA